MVMGGFEWLWVVGLLKGDNVWLRMVLAVYRWSWVVLVWMYQYLLIY